MPTSAQIAARATAICEASDPSTLTERQVRKQLAHEFGEQEVREHANAIRDAIEAFLTTLAEDGTLRQAQDTTSGPTPPNLAEARKRGVDEGEGNESSPKRARVEIKGNDLVLTLPSGSKHLSVRTFNGRVLVDLRKFWVDKATGQEKPSGQGIALSFTEWMALVPALPQLQAGMEAEDTSVSVQLAPLRRAWVTDVPVISVTVRELYVPSEGGEPKPGKKGITLTTSDVQALLQHADAVTQHAQRLGGTVAPAAGPSNPGPSQPKAGTGKTAAPAVTAGTSAPARPGASGGIELGGSKRVTHSTFKGGNFVDLREWYEKDGQLHPGKKGISLQLDEWDKLLAALPDIQAAVSRQDMSYVLPLANQRKVGLSTFKGALYVGVREYYVKGDQELPGAKGLSMNAGQFGKLVAGAHTFNASLPRG